jgi:prephenate dehydrogenase
MQKITKLNKIAIVGLGLMGGSFGLALRKYNLCDTILGVDHNLSHQKDALRLGLVDEIVELDDIKDIDNIDIIILAIPVDGIISISKELINISNHTTIIDFGGTKEKIVNAIPKQIRRNFIASHPMCGTERFGPEASIHNLYENKTMVLCDLEDNDELHATKAETLFKQIQMKIVKMGSKEHDIHACYMSHLPHAISFSLANIVMNHENPKDIISLAAGGFKDMSRIAKSSPCMWSDIFRQNRSNLIDSIELFEKELAIAKNMIKKEDYDNLHKWMSNANTLHDIL